MTGLFRWTSHLLRVRCVQVAWPEQPLRITEDICRPHPNPHPQSCTMQLNIYAPYGGGIANTKDLEHYV